MYSTALVRQLVLHFADLAGWEGQQYTVTQSKQTFNRAAKRHGSGAVDEDGEWGATLIRESDRPEPFPVTWVNPAIRDFHKLSSTCAHEALHAARPRFPHGPAYERAVRRMLRGLEP